MNNDPKEKTNSRSKLSPHNGISSLTQERATESNAIKIPEVSLPKGGGALKGIDEKFEVNAANGTAGFTVPLPATGGRNGFSPSLTLSYNSGSGNSPFGQGWSVSYPMIQRKTDKRLPRYQDGQQEDVFLFSGAADLVPFMEDVGGSWEEKNYPNNGAGGYAIKRYRPRVEGGFARIEKIHHDDHGVYWKVVTRENVATIFGRNPEARIADPEDGTRIFQWMPEFSYDDKGNWIKYRYKKEDLTNVPQTVNEKNRIAGIAPFTNCYLKRVQYGNATAYYADPATPYDPQVPAGETFFFELVMDYGEHSVSDPTPEDNGQWDYRPDAFSSFRSGFEIRTNRLCKRILMFHHFENELQFAGTAEEETFGNNYLVRSMDLEYQPSSINDSEQSETTYLASITQHGYIRKPGGTYTRKTLPPLEFTYETLNWNNTIKSIRPEYLANAPVGLTNNYQWVDLYGEGISGILTEQGDGWFYKENLGEVRVKGEPTFTAAKQVIPKPALSGLTNGILSIQDLERNGEKQLVVNDGSIKGYFELSPDNRWKPFMPFEQIAHIDLRDPNIRMLDLNGDGQPDIVMTEENVFTWYGADGKRGHLPFEQTSKPFDDEQGPAIVFADREQTIFLADMSGDGLTDIVRIRNGEVAYWSNKGYGNFSAKITMGNAPWFDHPELFNPRYLQLADVSGTGATDIIYFGKNKFKAFLNLSGNAWSNAHEIEPFFQIDSNSRLTVTDLLGNGTSCIVWSSELPAHANAPMQFIDLMDGKKPHVLTHYKNNFGKETFIEYKSSTYYYLKDKMDGRPWATKLPFPVQVVSKLMTEEKVTDVRFTSEYQYHHGYYDHPEREFRGFGMVEQVDSEYYEEWKRNNATNHLEASEQLYQKPVLTKTWFHTGTFLDRERTLSHFEDEYWQAEFNRRFPASSLSVDEPSLPDAILSDAVKALRGDEYREALSACKGMMLRQEVFALDAPENPTETALQLQMKPYTVASHNCYVQLLQPRDKNEYGVFLVTESEAVTIEYERDENDYRLAHKLNTKIDNLGNILENAAVVYGRRQDNANEAFQSLVDNITDFSQDVLNNDADQMSQLQNAFTRNIQLAKDEQTRTRIIYTQNNFAQYRSGTSQLEDIDLPHAYRLRMPHETKTFELAGFTPQNSLFKLDELENALSTATEIGYHENLGTAPQSRLIEHFRTKYLDDDLNELDFGFFDTLGLPCENYQKAFTPELLQDIYQQQDGTGLEVNGDGVNNIMGPSGKYSNLDGNWWIRSGITHFRTEVAEPLSAVQDRFYSPIAFEDPFGAVTTVIYDTESFTGSTRNNNGYYLFIKAITDAIDNKTQVDVFNYRTMSPTRMIDLNANPTMVLLDELGLVKALAIEGNGVFTGTTRSAVNIVQAADNLADLKEYWEDEETSLLTQLMGASTSNSTDTVQLRQAGNALLQRASIRFIYDFDTYYNTGSQPVVVASIAREEHFSDNNNSDVQFSFEYTDGMGQLAMTKVQAEPGRAYFVENGLRAEKNTSPEIRWVGNGRTVLNNKGNPVKQYESYFSTNFSYESTPELVEIGVTPILYYDPVGRLVKTEFPDGSLSRVEFDSWQQINFDQNDTVMEEGCEWYQRRTNPNRPDFINDPKQQQAAQKTAAHANTPSSLFLDSMGRPVLSIANNGKDIAAKDRLYTTFITLDIEGNTRNVVDPRGNTVMTYKYNMLGSRVYQNSNDAGERWMLNNLMGNPIHRWDSRNHVFSFTYDALQRPTSIRIQGGDSGALLDHIYEHTVYGEGQANEYQNNLRGQVAQQYDTAGRIQNLRLDFKGNLLESVREFNANYKDVPNWIPTNLNNAALFDSDLTAYSTRFEYDALNRTINTITPDNSETKPRFNEAGLLEQVRVTQTGISEKLFVKNIDYDAKGQREQIVYGDRDGNDLATTVYEYDEATFRLIHLQTTDSDGGLLQDLHYTYDPLGNISEIEDRAIPIRFFNNFRIEPRGLYQYDALYRLVEARGKEHAGQAINFSQCDNWKDQAFLRSYSVNDDMAWRNYTQRYLYDPVGNILETNHDAPGGDWTRTYHYESENNRLSQTRIGGQTYAYPHHPQHGFITSMPHLHVMEWNFKDELQAVATRAVCNNDTLPEITYYIYNSEGQRVRKVTDNNGGGSKKEERLYLGGLEVYLKHSGNHNGLERTTLHIMDDTRRIAMVDTRNTVDDNTDERTVRFQFSNHLGSASLELDDEGTVVSYEEYHPFGTTAHQAVNRNIRAAAKRYRYTNMERDEESGLSYHTARYYLPWLGRWLSADPLFLIDGVNLFRYGKNNPVTFTDPAGTDPPEDDEPVRQLSLVPFGQIFGDEFGFVGALLDPPEPSNIRAVYSFGTADSFTGLSLTSEESLPEMDLPDGLKWLRHIPLTIGNETLLVPDQSRIIFGQLTQGYRIESGLTFTLSLGPIDIGAGTNTIIASGEIGEVETQTVGEFSLGIADRFELTYRNDHDFSFGALPISLLGGGTDQGLTTEVELNYTGRHRLGSQFTLTQVGLALELNTGKPLEYGPPGSVLPFYSQDQILGSEIDNGLLELRVGFEHNRTGIRFNVHGGVNSTAIRAGVQDPVHRHISDSPIFPQYNPGLSPSFGFSISVPSDSSVFDLFSRRR
ncbi:MAG: SpvB/TcaC N-terminal domain-containing protein [Bacteroidota bacterium]